MSKSYVRYIWILPVLWMCVIFMFSNQPSDDSSQLSGEVTQVIESVAEFLQINTARFDLHLFIRKAAHFTEFAVLGLLLFIAIYPSRKAVTQEETDRNAARVTRAITRKAAGQKTIADKAVKGKPVAVNAAGKAAAKAGLLAQAAGMGYAVFDEIHQIFIPGRSCQVKDMLIDSSGVLLAVLLCYVFAAMSVHVRKNTKPML